MKFPITLGLIVALISSCVSTKEFDQVVSEKQTLEGEKANLAAQVEAQDQKIQDLQRKADQLVLTEKELDAQKAMLTNLQASQEDLRMQYDELLKQNQQLVESTSEDKIRLAEQLTVKQQALDQKEREQQFLEMKLGSQEENLEALQQDIVIRERRLSELTKQLRAKASQMDSIRDGINNALKSFSSEDFNVSEYNGKVYIGLSESLLFTEGSNILGSRGRDAIRRIGKILQQHPDIEINVEGHTDPDGSSDENWDLSVTRATTVVKRFISDGLDPHQVIASGRGQYFPRVPNDSEEAMAINRRTEIILSPDLNALYSLLN